MDRHSVLTDADYGLRRADDIRDWDKYPKVPPFGRAVDVSRNEKKCNEDGLQDDEHDGHMVQRLAFVLGKIVEGKHRGVDSRR